MDFSKLGQAAAETDNQSEEKQTARAIPRAGVALLRLREYLELGRHAPKNPQHKPSNKVMLVFELLHPDHIQKFDDGERPMTLTVRVNKTGSMKGKFLPLFKAMNYDGKAQHMVQMLGKPFLGTLHHNKDGDNTYVNLDDEQGKWCIGAPIQTDALLNTKTDIPVPELHGDMKAFLWENTGVTDDQIKEMWDSIYIEGEREVKDAAGKVTGMKSKNWIQETIMQNLEWEGSVTQALTQEHIDLDELDKEQEEGLAAMAGAADDVPSLDD
jgi:hypothetical protein